MLDEAQVAAMREKKWRRRDPEMENVERLNDTLQVSRSYLHVVRLYLSVSRLYLSFSKAGVLNLGYMYPMGYILILYGYILCY